MLTALPPIPPAITALAEHYDRAGSYQPTAADYAEMAEQFALSDAVRYCPGLVDLMRKVIGVVNHPAFVREWGTELAVAAAPYEPWFDADANDDEPAAMIPSAADLPF